MTLIVKLILYLASGDASRVYISPHMGTKLFQETSNRHLETEGSSGAHGKLCVGHTTSWQLFLNEMIRIILHISENILNAEVISTCPRVRYNSMGLCAPKNTSTLLTNENLLMERNRAFHNANKHLKILYGRLQKVMQFIVLCFGITYLYFSIEQPSHCFIFII